MSASITSTSASSDSTTDPKALLKYLTESLESLRDRIATNKISKPWSNRMPQFEVLKEQLRRLQDKNLVDGISISDVEKLQGILRWVGKDKDEKPDRPGEFKEYSGERERTIFDASTEKEDGKSNLENTVDELVEQMNSRSFHPQTPTWKPRTPADHVGGISRALESLLKYDVRWGWTPDVKRNLEDLRDRIEKLNIKNISNHGDEADMLKKFYGIVMGTGNNVSGSSCTPMTERMESRLIKRVLTKMLPWLGVLGKA